MGAVATLTVGVAKGLQLVGILPRKLDFGADQGSEKAAVAWRGEAEAREAQVKRQEEEIGRLGALVSRLSERLDAQQVEIHDLKVQRDELLARPDYTILLERFLAVEEITAATLTLLKAHDQMTLTRLDKLPVLSSVDERLANIERAVVPSELPD